MKKLILKLIKNHEQKNKLDLISELLVSGTVEENIELFTKAKANFHLAMDLYKNQEEKRINLINRIRPIKEYDTHFDTKLTKDIETNFEILSNGR